MTASWKTWQKTPFSVATKKDLKKKTHETAAGYKRGSSNRSAILL